MHNESIQSIPLSVFSDLHWSVILSIFSLTGFFCTFVAAVLIDGDVGTKHIFPVSTVEWAFLVSIGFTSFIVQVSFTRALQLEMAAKVSMERKAADVIFAFLYQIVIFAVCPFLCTYSVFFDFRCIFYYMTGIQKVINLSYDHSFLGDSNIIQRGRCCSNIDGLNHFRNSCISKGE